VVEDSKFFLYSPIEGTLDLSSVSSSDEKVVQRGEVEVEACVSSPLWSEVESSAR